MWFGNFGCFKTWILGLGGVSAGLAAFRVCLWLFWWLWFVWVSDLWAWLI